MKTLLLLLVSLVACVVPAGCARTTVYGPNGKKVLRTSADATGVRMSGPGWTFVAARLDHSTPTLAGGKAASDKLGAAGAAVAASGVMALLH